MEKKLSIVDENGLLDEVVAFIKTYGEASVQPDGRYRNGTTVFLVSAQDQPDLVERLVSYTNISRETVEREITAAYEHWCSTPESDS